MIQEAISPTRERLSKGDRIEAPEYSQTSQRAYHRTVHKFEDLFQNGKINEGCKEAGGKLMKHYFGSLGVNVSSGDGSCDVSDTEFPQTYHGQMLVKARDHIGNANCWSALVACVEETRTLEEIGRDWLGCRQRGQAYIAGLAIVSMGLERLSTLWGFSQSFHARPPSR